MLIGASKLIKIMQIVLGRMWCSHKNTTVQCIPYVSNGNVRIAKLVREFGKGGKYGKCERLHCALQHAGYHKLTAKYGLLPISIDNYYSYGQWTACHHVNISTWFEAKMKFSESASSGEMTTNAFGCVSIVQMYVRINIGIRLSCDGSSINMKGVIQTSRSQIMSWPFRTLSLI